MSKYVELRELEARATSGPWVTYDARSHVQALDGSLAVVCHYGNTDRPFSDAALICATRNALPGLLDELEAAQKLLGRWQVDADDEQGTQDERAVFAHCVAGLTRALGLWGEST